jgi:citronellol/citronellal dehydrogenase
MDHQGTAGIAAFAETIWAAPTVFRDGLFDGRVAIVTGGGSGIGLAIALGLARLGARVAICGRKREKLDAVAAFAASKGRSLLVQPTDIRETDQVAALFDRVAAEIGVPHVLVNNAGGQFPQPSIEFSAKGWNTVINTNLNGTWHMMQAAARLWRDRGVPGCIVNIVAPTERGMPGIAHTVAARAGVVGLMNTVAVEWAPLGIRVNCLSPGLTDTGGLNVYPPEARKEFPKANALKRPATATEIAEAAIFLASPSASFITGELMHVDGGYQRWGELWTAGRPPYFTFAED